MWAGALANNNQTRKPGRLVEEKQVKKEDGQENKYHLLVADEGGENNPLVRYISSFPPAGTPGGGSQDWLSQNSSPCSSSRVFINNPLPVSTPSFPPS